MGGCVCHAKGLGSLQAQLMSGLPDKHRLPGPPDLALCLTRMMHTYRCGPAPPTHAPNIRTVLHVSFPCAL